MEHKAEVGLIEPHPQGTRGHESLDLIGLEALLELLSLGSVGAAGVGIHRVARVPQQPGGIVGRRHRERVNDAAARKLCEVAENPGEPFRRTWQPQNSEAEGCPGERSADRDDVGAWRSVTAAELLHDIRDHPAVGGGRRRKHRNPLRQ